MEYIIFFTLIICIYLDIKFSHYEKIKVFLHLLVSLIFGIHALSLESQIVPSYYVYYLFLTLHSLYNKKFKNLWQISLVYFMFSFMQNYDELFVFMLQVQFLELVYHLNKIEESNKGSTSYHTFFNTSVRFLGLALLLLSTNQLNMTKFQILNKDLFFVSVSIFMLLFISRLGIYPFWKDNKNSIILNGSLTTNFTLVSYVFLNLFFLQNLIQKLAPSYQFIFFCLALAFSLVHSLYYYFYLNEGKGVPCLGNFYSSLILLFCVSEFNYSYYKYLFWVILFFNILDAVIEIFFKKFKEIYLLVPAIPMVFILGNILKDILSVTIFYFILSTVFFIQYVHIIYLRNLQRERLSVGL